MSFSTGTNMRIILACRIVRRKYNKFSLISKIGVLLKSIIIKKQIAVSQSSTL
jgi:hypothetical protein